MSDKTSWTLIDLAATGDDAARAEFTRHYLPVVRAYLQARWRNRLGSEDTEDAVQEVFVECFKEDGVLDRVAAIRTHGFRSFLYGVARNVALRVEERRGRQLDRPQAKTFYGDDQSAEDPTLSRIFDGAWARSVMKQAGELQAAQARESGPEAKRRVELLRFRFQEGLKIREIARLWEVDPTKLHEQYALAREEFERSLREVVSRGQPGSRESVGRLCHELLALLG